MDTNQIFLILLLAVIIILIFYIFFYNKTEDIDPESDDEEEEDEEDEEEEDASNALDNTCNLSNFIRSRILGSRISENNFLVFSPGIDMFEEKVLNTIIQFAFLDWMSVVNDNLTLLLDGIDLKEYNRIMRNVFKCVHTLSTDKQSGIEVQRCTVNKLIKNSSYMHGMLETMYANIADGVDDIAFPEYDMVKTLGGTVSEEKYEENIAELRDNLKRFFKEHPELEITEEELKAILESTVEPTKLSFTLRNKLTIISNDLAKVFRLGDLTNA